MEKSKDFNSFGEGYYNINSYNQAIIIYKKAIELPYNKNDKQNEYKESTINHKKAIKLNFKPIYLINLINLYERIIEDKKISTNEITKPLNNSSHLIQEGNFLKSNNTISKLTYKFSI